MPQRIRNRRWQGPAREAEWRRARQMAREAIRETVGCALFKFFAKLDEQLRDIRQGIRRLRAMDVTSSELEQKEVARLWAILVVVENAMDDGWPVEGEAPIKVQLL